jgi:hypothetical protein
VERQCQLAEVSRAGFYRYLQQSTPAQADLLLRARLQELAVEHRRLRGYRLLTIKLQREGQFRGRQFRGQMAVSGTDSSTPIRNACRRNRSRRD